MQATALIAVAIVAGFIIAVAVGLWWFVALPVAALLLLIPAGYTIAYMTQRKARPPSNEARGLPSTREASYDPVSDPSKPGTTPR